MLKKPLSSAEPSAGYPIKNSNNRKTRTREVDKEASAEEKVKKLNWRTLELRRSVNERLTMLFRITNH